jgi:hypothetical protein
LIFEGFQAAGRQFEGDCQQKCQQKSIQWATLEGFELTPR